MEWVSVHSTHEVFDEAWNEVRGQLQAALSREPDLLIIFLSVQHAKHWSNVARFVAAIYPHAVLYGGSGRGTLEGEDELETEPSMSVMAACVGAGARLQTVYLPPEPAAYQARLREISWSDFQGAMVLIDPLSIEAEQLVDTLDQLVPFLTKTGGLLSGGSRHDQHALWSKDGVYEEGAMLLLLGGTLSMQVVVAQNALPIGEPLIVMRNRGHLIDAFDKGRPAEVLRKAIEALPQRRDADLLERIAMGVDVSEDSEVWATPSYLMRTLIGVDAGTGSVAVATRVRDYQVVRFHLRDPALFEEAFAMELEVAQRWADGQHLRGAVMFSCTANLKPPSHQRSEAQIVAQSLPNACSIGLICSAEVGPIGQRTFVQSYTTTVALLYETTLN